MRRVIASEYVSLDGVMEEPRWTAPFWNDEAAEVAHAQLFASDALLLGRVTYEGFAKAWPAMTDEQGFADRMNALPKYVATTTLTELTWNNAQRLAGDVAEAVATLKAQDGGNLLIYGSADLVDTLTRAGLVDEYRLWVHPVVLGTGKRLFRDGTAAGLKLIDTKTTSTGVAILTYAPAEPGV